LQLFIVRHAWAGEFGDYADDRVRPLTDEGRKRFASVVHALAKRGFAPVLVLTSPLVRCRETAEIIAEGVPGKPPIVVRPELEPSSQLLPLLAWQQEHAAKCREVAWVGHMPDVADFVAYLTGGGESCADFAKGAVACLKFDTATPQPGLGVLRWMVTAKILGC